MLQGGRIREREESDGSVDDRSRVRRYPTVMHDVGLAGFWGMPGVWVISLVWLFAILVLAIGGWRLIRGGRRPEEPPSPKRTLQDRYARGEIGREEYLERLADLARGSRV